MTSSRPYLIRALYEWIVDNGLTPYLLVDTGHDGVEAPLEYADNGKLVLNVAPRAVRSLNLGNDGVAFNARFGGVSRDVWLPTPAVLAIYARENGQGMLFTDDDGGDEPPPDGGGDDGGGDKRPQLRVVK
jgi:stringent starvation protein B